MLPARSLLPGRPHPDHEFSLRHRLEQRPGSNINLSYTDVVAEGMEQVTGAGTVTSGEFTGAAVTIIWLDTVPDPLQCLTPGGVTGQTGPMTAEITL